MRDKPFIPLRIRAYLQSGVISDQFLPLDGVLYYHICREEFGPQDATKPNESSINEAKGMSLPLMKCNQKSDAWFYSCSFAQWPDHTIEDKETYSKRFRIKYSDLIDFQGKRGKVQTARGKYKSYHIELYYRHALYVDWFVRGNPEELDRLLPFCTHIGKKTSQGWGQVLEWDVKEIEEDWSVRGPDNKLMRAVPSKKHSYIYGIRPSYWNDRHQFTCLMP